MAEGAAAQTIRVKTTLPAQPLPSNAKRPHINTERLIIRPFAQDDCKWVLETRPPIRCLFGREGFSCPSVGSQEEKINDLELSDHCRSVHRT